LKERLEKVDIKVDHRLHVKLFNILNERSLMIFNGRIFHEAIKGIVNKRLFCEINNNLFKDAIKEFVSDIKELARKHIWKIRCEEVNQ
jgi:hypothetical protein